MKRIIRIHSNKGQDEVGDTLYDAKTERSLAEAKAGLLLLAYRYEDLRIIITTEDMREEDFDRLPDYEPVGTC
jgi:hypothetical protein